MTGLILIGISGYYSFRELNKRLEIINLIKNYIQR